MKQATLKNKINKKMGYYELGIGNTGFKYEEKYVIIKAYSIIDAVERYFENTGKMLLHGKVYSVREIYFVYDDLKNKEEKAK